MLGKQSIQFERKPYIISSASIVGSKEAEGPMGELFDKVGYDDSFGAENWEEAESRLQKEALEIAISKEGLTKQDIQMVFAGDLLGQSIASSFGLAGYQLPHIGLYGACSTCGLSLTMGGMMVSAGVCRESGMYHIQPFCQRGEGVPLPAFLRQPETQVGNMDRDGKRRFPRLLTAGEADPGGDGGCDDRQNRGLRCEGFHEYGRLHGACGGGYDCAESGGFRQGAEGL